MAITEVMVSLALPKELAKRINRAAKRRRLTRSGLIRLALTEWLEQQGLKEK